MQQQPLLPAQPTLNTATMASATITYPFTYTTFTNPTPQPFTKPTILPTGMFSFGPVMSCSASASASAKPSGAPLAQVSGTAAGCVISNSQEDSTHAFWDLYDCCKARNISAIGKPLPCSAQCLVGNEQTWQDLGSCLSKRNNIVVCKPADNEVGSAAPSSKSAAAASSGTASGAAPSKASATSVVGSSSASSVDAMHATFSKAGVFVFALVAVTSAAGMFL